MANQKQYESRISSFEPSEYGGEPEEQEEDRGDEVLAELSQEESEVVETDDPDLNDVDLRLETADYYRAILKHNFFDTTSKAAQVVDRELRTIIRERLEILLGLRGPKVEQAQAELPFDEDQISALKALADKVLNRPHLLGGSTPQVKKMPTPAPQKEQKPIALKPKPQVKKIPAPTPAPSTKAPQKPAPKLPQPQAKKPQTQAVPKAPVQQQKPQRAKVAAPKGSIVILEPGIEGGVEQSFKSHDGEMVTLVEGQIFEENGRRFKVEMNGTGTLFRKDITGQVAPPNRHPPMTVEQISMMSRMHAEQQLGNLDELTGSAIVASLSQQ